MVITIPDKILGVKMASSSDDERPRLNLVVDKFSPTLGVNLKVWSISDADLYSATKKKNQEYDHESPPRRVIYDEICCGLNPRKSVLSRSSHIENTKKVSVGRLMRSGCKVHYLRRRQKILAAYNKRRLAPPPSVLNNCFPHEDVLSNSATTQTITALSVFPFKSPRRSINGWKLSPANLSPLMKKDHHCKEIAIEKSCIEAKTKKSEGLNQEHKQMLFRATANLLRNNGFTNSANTLMEEANIKMLDSVAEPPDVEGIFLSFLRKGESDALEEKRTLKQLASSLEKMLSSSDTKDADIFSMYTAGKSEKSNTQSDYLCHNSNVIMDDMHKNTDEKHVLKFFQKAKIKVARVKFHGVEPNFRNVLKKSATISFSNPEDAKKAAGVTGSFLKISKRPIGSYVFISRCANDRRVFCVRGFKGDLNDEGYIQEELYRFFKDCDGIKIVTVAQLEPYEVCYVLVEATLDIQKWLVELDGSEFARSGNGLVCRQAKLTADAFERVFASS